jgi:hypothetical protein
MIRHAQRIRLANVIARAAARMIVVAIADDETDADRERRRLLELVARRLVESHGALDELADLQAGEADDGFEVRDVATTLELRAAAGALERALRLMPNRVGSRFDPKNDVPALTREVSR